MQVLENASTEMGSMKYNYAIPEDGKRKYCKHKYEFARVENVSMENASTRPQRRKTQVRKI